MLYLLTNYIIKMTPEAERFNGWAAMLGSLQQLVHTSLQARSFQAGSNEK